jgi:hypothetical protein
MNAQMQARRGLEIDLRRAMALKQFGVLAVGGGDGDADADADIEHVAIDDVGAPDEIDESPSPPPTARTPTTC